MTLLLSLLHYAFLALLLLLLSTPSASSVAI